MPSIPQLKAEVSRLLKLIQQTPFDECLPLERGFQNLPNTAGVYALRTVSEVLYVGKAGDFRTRFKNHQALSSIYIDKIPPEAVRILLMPLSAYYYPHMLLLERQVTFVLRPSYNSSIPPVDEIEKLMQLRQSPPSSGVQDLLRFMPDPVIEAVEQFAEANRISVPQAVEFAFASFLNVEATSFGEAVDSLQSPGATKEENAILKLKLEATRKALAEAGLPDPSDILGL